MKRTHAKNKVLLAQAIDISRPALYRLFELPDHPQQTPGLGWNISHWQKFADRNISYWNKRDPHKNGSNGNGATPNPRDAAFIKRQNIAAEKEQFDLDIKRDKYELKSKVREDVLTFVNAMMRELNKAFRHELPPRVEGLKAIEIARLNGKRLDDLRERLVKNFEGNGSNGN